MICGRVIADDRTSVKDTGVHANRVDRQRDATSVSFILRRSGKFAAGRSIADTTLLPGCRDRRYQ